MTNSDLQIRYILNLDRLQALTIQRKQGLLAIMELGTQAGKTAAEIEGDLISIGINPKDMRRAI